ncbi:hypothetical protein PE36_09703 [Moritella sp. PE36]|uniref:2OG-Fe dioxygenase family protein n=1 Tax=Moritella sp. PE36 TaxID=58051 RepID=UPI0001568B53|nr:2OG-Fe dioxygenase family protein [Moritella sp. PE36]EDM65682.1 hypothetical protein PE36_09703 [Moritella sp. PE36]
MEAVVPKKQFVDVINNFCVVSNIDDLLGDSVLDSLSWKVFKESWSDLGLDEYMNDGGKYRKRNFCKLRYHVEDDSLWMKEHDFYFQPPSVNALNGGLERWFSPVKGEVFYNSVVNTLLKTMGSELSKLTGQKTWDINFYQNRIISELGEAGKPSPEGIHKDGVKFSILLLMDRSNVTGGENTIFDLDKKPIFSHTLTQEGECIIFADEPTYHFASPIEQISPDVAGKRDILVVEFY